LTLLKALTDELGVDKERLFLLSYPEAKDLIKSSTRKRTSSEKRNAWQESHADKAALARNKRHKNSSVKAYLIAGRAQPARLSVHPQRHFAKRSSSRRPPVNAARPPVAAENPCRLNPANHPTRSHCA
jgi:hypothetical protein